MSGYSTTRGVSTPNDASKRQGAIFRGFGPPVPQAGVTGDLYIDNVTFQFFEKRDINGVDAWGHFLFAIPAMYQTTLKWFGPNGPSNEIGVVGDYFLQWAGYPNYGMQPIIWGPKTWTGWPENGDGPGTVIVGSTVLPIGLLSEGAPLADVQPSRLTAIGLLSEYIIPVPVTANPGDPVLELGLQSSGSLVTVNINTLYTAEDEHSLTGFDTGEGIFTLNTAGAKNTATLLAAAGLVSNFTTLNFSILTAPGGVLIAQGVGSATYPQGASVSFTNVSVALNAVTITLAAGDVVQVAYSGS